jgi:hypothetical protein
LPFLCRKRPTCADFCLAGACLPTRVEGSQGP